MRNAIPRECEAIITVPEEEVEDVLAYVGECEQVWREEYETIEEGLSFQAERVDLPKYMVPEEIRDNLVDAIYACPNGVERYIPTIPDTVETSSNLAIVDIKGGKASVKILTRSARESMKDYRNTALESCFLGTECQFAHSSCHEGSLSGTVRRSSRSESDSCRTGVRHHRSGNSGLRHDFVRSDFGRSAYSRREMRNSVRSQVLRFPDRYACQYAGEIIGLRN